MNSTRRPPRVVSFLATGALIGFGIGILIAIWPRSAEDPSAIGTYSPMAAFGYLGFLFMAIGALVGGLVAVLFDLLHIRSRK